MSSPEPGAGYACSQAVQSAPPSGKSCPFSTTRLWAPWWLGTCFIYHHILRADQGLWHTVYVLRKGCKMSIWGRFCGAVHWWMLVCNSNCYVSCITFLSCGTQKVHAATRSIALWRVLCFRKVHCSCWPRLWRRYWLACSPALSSFSWTHTQLDSISHCS